MFKNAQNLQKKIDKAGQALVDADIARQRALVEKAIDDATQQAEASISIDNPFPIISFEIPETLSFIILGDLTTADWCISEDPIEDLTKISSRES